MEKYVGPTTVQVLKTFRLCEFSQAMIDYQFLVPQSTPDSLVSFAANQTNKHLSTMKSIILAFYKKIEYGEWIMLGERSGCERAV